MKAKIIRLLAAASAAACLATFGGCELIGDIFGITHEHTPSDEYDCDETLHWNYCEECGERLNTGRHSISVWQSDESTHWQECMVCGYVMNSSAHTYNSANECTVCGYVLSSGSSSGETAAGNEQDIISADLSIHFIAPEVKASGDCALIKVGDTEVLIDAGPNTSNLSAIKNYLNEYCTDNVIEYVIATHADTDHIACFAGTTSKNGILYNYEVGTIIQFAQTNSTTATYSRYQQAVEYAQEQGTTVYDALQCWEQTDGAQRTYYLDDEQTISLNILYNYYYDHESSDENNYSVCFLLTQELENGEEYNYLFTGDLEEEGEEYLVQYNELPEVELYKAGHHGSKTSSNECLLEVIKPKNVVVCCCAGYNQYNAKDENVFPTQAFVSRVSAYTDNVYIPIMYDEETNGYTSMNGDIVFYYSKTEDEEQGSLKLWCSNNTTKLKDTEWFAANRVWG